MDLDNSRKRGVGFVEDGPDDALPEAHARAQKVVSDGIQFDVADRFSPSANRRDRQKGANYSEWYGRRARSAERWQKLLRFQSQSYDAEQHKRDEDNQHSGQRKSIHPYEKKDRPQKPKSRQSGHCNAIEPGEVAGEQRLKKASHAERRAHQ